MTYLFVGYFVVENGCCQSDIVVWKTEMDSTSAPSPSESSVRGKCDLHVGIILLLIMYYEMLLRLVMLMFRWTFMI